MNTFKTTTYTAKSSAMRNAKAQLATANVELNGRSIEIVGGADLGGGDVSGFFWANSLAFQSQPKDELLRVSAMKGACALVWDIAEAMLTENPSIKRAAILAACVANGIAYYTARTQYQLYRQAKLNSITP
jgi:hypothetical protein